MFITVGSCPGIAAGLITVCGANLSLVSTILIVLQVLQPMYPVVTY